jgi:hypothetical protein
VTPDVTPDEQARRIARATFVTRLFILVAAVVAAALVVGLVVLVGLIRSTQIDNTAKADARDETIANTARTLRLVRSCVTPSGKCYERGQAQTAEAVGNINRVVILAAACAAQMPGGTVESITKCVTDQLAQP